LKRSRRLLLRDLSWLSLGYAGRSAGYLIVTVALTRGLGPSGYGVVSIFLALGAGIAYLASSWAFNALPILVPAGRPLGPVFRAALKLSLLGAALCATVVLPIAWTTLPQHISVVVFLGIYALGLIGMQGLFSIFQTRGTMGAIALLQTGERVLAVSLVVLVAALAELTPPRAEAVVALSPFVAAAVLLARVSRGVDFVRGTSSIREIVDAVGLLAVISAGSYLVAWVDIVILAAFRSDHEVGVYALAYQVFTVILQFGSLWIVATLPRHARRISIESSASKDLVPAGPLWTGSLTWAAGCGAVALLSTFLLTLIFGNAFSATLGPLMLLLGSAAGLAPYFAAVSAMMAQRRFRELAWVTAIGVGMNVVLDIALVPFIGYWGPAIATALQGIVVTVLALQLAVGRQATVRLMCNLIPGLVSISIASAAPRHPAALLAIGLAMIFLLFRSFAPPDLAYRRLA
jgi:O-antigen/teichoic acid export membrane protein